MNLPDGRLIFGYWLVVMIFIAASAGFFMLGNATAKTKRKAFYWYVGVGGLLLAGWFYMLGGLSGLLLCVPLYAVSSFICLKTTRFCDACGKTLMNQFFRARYCPRCGADLDDQDAERNANVQQP